MALLVTFPSSRVRSCGLSTFLGGDIALRLFTERNIVGFGGSCVFIRITVLIWDKNVIRFVGLHKYHLTLENCTVDAVLHYCHLGGVFECSELAIDVLRENRYIIHLSQFRPVVSLNILPECLGHYIDQFCMCRLGNITLSALGHITTG